MKVEYGRGWMYRTYMVWKSIGLWKEKQERKKEKGKRKKEKGERRKDGWSVMMDGERESLVNYLVGMMSTFEARID